MCQEARIPILENSVLLGTLHDLTVKCNGACVDQRQPRGEDLPRMATGQARLIAMQSRARASYNLRCPRTRLKRLVAGAALKCLSHQRQQLMGSMTFNGGCKVRSRIKPLPATLACPGVANVSVAHVFRMLWRNQPLITSDACNSICRSSEIEHHNYLPYIFFSFSLKI